MQPITVTASPTASGFVISFEISVNMLVEVVERKRHSFLGAVKGPDGFESSARLVLPINVGCKATQCSPRLPIAESISKFRQ